MFKKLVCGALVGASLFCGVGCNSQPVEKIIEREVVREIEVEVEKEVIVEKEVLVEVPIEIEKEIIRTQMIYTPIDLSQVNILTPLQIDKLTEGDTITNVLVWAGYLAKGIETYNEPQFDNGNYGSSFYLRFNIKFKGYYSNIRFHTADGSSINSVWCISGKVTKITKTTNNLDYTESIDVWVEPMKGE